MNDSCPSKGSISCKTGKLTAAVVY